MANRIDDRQVDALSFSPPAQPGDAPTIEGDDGSEATMLLFSALAVFSPSLLNYLAEGLLDREGVTVDEIGIRYPGDELDEDEEPFDGVKLVSPMGEVLVSLDAFERLMGRYLGTYVTSLEQAPGSAASPPALDEVRRAVAALAERQRPGGAGGAGA